MSKLEQIIPATGWQAVWYIGDADTAILRKPLIAWGKFTVKHGINDNIYVEYEEDIVCGVISAGNYTRVVRDGNWCIADDAFLGYAHESEPDEKWLEKAKRLREKK